MTFTVDRFTVDRWWTKRNQMEHRHYKNPPVVEAFVEFRFEPSQEFDLTMPGKLHTALEPAYPGKPRQQKLVQASFESSSGHPTKVGVAEGIGKIQFLNEEKNRIVAVGADVLSVHILRPYEPGWKEDFCPRINAALSEYWRVAEPVGVRRIEMRYINKIVVPQEMVELNHYLACAPPEARGLPEHISGFVSRVDYVYPDGATLNLTHSSVASAPGSIALLLDISVSRPHPPLSQKQALESASDLRSRERVVFEAVITEKTRELFNA